MFVAQDRPVDFVFEIISSRCRGRARDAEQRSLGRLAHGSLFGVVHSESHIAVIQYVTEGRDKEL